MNIIVIKYPGCIFDEVEPTITLLSKQFLLKIVDLNEISSDLMPDLLIIPGGSCDDPIIHPQLHEVIQSTFLRKKIIATICNGVLVMASAGILKRKNCTHTAHPKYAPLPEFKELLEVASKLFENTVYIDEDVVIDENIISAKPWAALDFAKAIESKLVT